MNSLLDDNLRREREQLIAKEYNGIYPVYEAFYIHSIIYCADRSRDAFHRFDEAVKHTPDAALIVATVQDALAHAGALSRFFWPMKKSKLAAARGARLRAAFALNDRSPLRLRHLWNAFEHFDEDLDLFLLQDPAGYFFPGPLVDDHTLADEAIGNIFRLVDPKHQVCVLLGEKFEFGQIREEVGRILAEALVMDSQGCRLRTPAGSREALRSEEDT